LFVASDMRGGSGHMAPSRLGLVFGNSFRFRVFCLDIRESIANAGMHDSFGIVQLSGKPGEKRKYRKVSRKELEAPRRESVCFPFVSPGVLTGGRRD